VVAPSQQEESHTVPEREQESAATPSKDSRDVTGAVPGTRSIVTRSVSSAAVYVHADDSQTEQRRPDRANWGVVIDRGCKRDRS
jgi:hypothetical protein